MVEDWVILCMLWYGQMKPYCEIVVSMLGSAPIKVHVMCWCFMFSVEMLEVHRAVTKWMTASTHSIGSEDAKLTDQVRIWIILDPFQGIIVLF